MNTPRPMQGMNIELTTCCPLHCPQCYCSLEGGKHIDLEVATARIDEAAQHGVQIVHLSGGESLCYPHLTELVAHATGKIPHVHVAVSGWKFTPQTLEELVAAGVTGLFVSLNGSTREINAMTRDGYDYALHALEVMRDAGYINSYLNWVMHANNSDDFPNLLRLAEEYQVSYLMVLMFKPDAAHRLATFPSSDQIKSIAEQIKSYRGNTKIMVETCFSQLLACIRDTRLFGNLNVGPMKGCRAGVYNYSITVDGLYAPCRHLDYAENHSSLEAYLSESTVIQQIQLVEAKREAPCDQCRYADYCKPCVAIPSKLQGRIVLSHPQCELWR